MERKKTYIAFDAMGVINHEFSNFAAFLQLERYEKTYGNRFDFVNMDEIKFAAEHEGMLTTTLQQRFVKDMREADNVLVVASPVVNVDSEILSWQIRTAVYRHRLPLIVAYAHHESLSDEDIQNHHVWLPQAVREMVEGNHAYVAHVPFTIDKLERALKTFSAKEQVYPWSATTIF